MPVPAQHRQKVEPVLRHALYDNMWQRGIGRLPATTCARTGQSGPRRPACQPQPCSASKAQPSSTNTTAWRSPSSMQ